MQAGNRGRVRTLRAIVAPVFLATAFLATACSREEPLPTPRRVVLIVLDALHAKHLGSYGGPEGLTPWLDRVALGGMRFDRAFSNNTWTLASTTSLMTGRLQESHGIVTNNHTVHDGIPLLAEQFERAGWNTAGFVQMLYASDVYGLDRGFRDYTSYGIGAGKPRTAMMEDVQRWLQKHRRERTFVYLHFRRPHGTYNPIKELLAPLETSCELADGRRDAFLSQAQILSYHELPHHEREHVRHLYQANLATVDHNLAPVLQECLAQPDTLVVITSDHGEGLGEHGYYGHGDSLLAENVDIPLIFRGPGIPPGVDADPACTIDVLPTILELCDLPLPPGADVDGVSLVGRLAQRERASERTIPFSARYKEETIPAHGVVVGDVKVILDAEDRVRVYDRRADPRDDRERSAELTELASTWGEWLRERRDRFADLWKQGVGESPVLTEEQVEDLRALGYVK